MAEPAIQELPKCSNW